METENNILVIAPYVYICQEGMDFLLYNTLNGEYIMGDNVEVVNIVKILLKPYSQWIYKFQSPVMMSTVVKDFVKAVEQKNMGRYLVGYSCNTPIQTYPIQNLQYDVKKYRDKAYKIGDNVVEYLHELSIYANNDCENTCLQCSALYKQHLFCHKGALSQSIDLNNLERFLTSIRLPSLYRINLLGVYLSKFNLLNELLVLLQSLNVPVYCFINYTWVQDVEDLLRKPFNPIILVDMSMYKMGQAFFTSKDIQYDFIVSNELELEQANRLIVDGGLSKSRILPYYKKKCYGFLKNNVFIDKSDIFLRTHTFRDLYRNATLNSHYFGKLTIMADGQIYADVAKPALGSIAEHTLSELIWKELESGHSWLRTRNYQKPCKDCVLRDFCPPTSGIEAAMRKNNLCFKSKR